MSTHKVRTKSKPWQEVEVSDAGLVDLQRRGALVEEDKPADKPAPKAAPRKRAPRKKATAKAATTSADGSATDTSKEG